MSVFRLNVMVVGLVIVSTGAFAWGWLLPGMDDLRDRHDQIATELEALQKQQRSVGDVGSLYQSIVGLSEEMSNFERRLPTKRRIGEFRHDLTQCLEGSGIRYYRPKELPAVEADPQRLPEHLRQAARTVILPIRVSFTSAFSDVFEFLKCVEDLERLSHVESVEMENDEGNPGSVRVQIVLHTFHRPQNATAEGGEE